MEWLKASSAASAFFFFSSSATTCYVSHILHPAAYDADPASRTPLIIIIIIIITIMSVGAEAIDLCKEQSG
jgi:hypothetical protein